MANDATGYPTEIDRRHTITDTNRDATNGRTPNARAEIPRAPRAEHRQTSRGDVQNNQTPAQNR
eukprot:3214478-Lingulodinium_polyedra.AAC.1